MPNMGMQPTKTSDSLASMLKDTTSENASITGARMAMRMIIWKAICTLLTSVVSRVTMLAVENLSILAKEYVCTL